MEIGIILHVGRHSILKLLQEIYIYLIFSIVKVYLFLSKHIVVPFPLLRSNLSGDLCIWMSRANNERVLVVGHMFSFFFFFKKKKE